MTHFFILCCRSFRNRGRSYFRIFCIVLARPEKGGFFVEFGATDGVELSNTLLLERNYGWNGVLAEPAKCWHEDLRSNRTCVIDTRCVWKQGGEVLEFNEVSDRELSTIAKYSNHGGHFVARRTGRRYPVETVSLHEFLSSHNAPNSIDYLSVDTEGPEFDILETFDFQNYDVKFITVEHGFTLNRDRICGLLESSGFSRMFEGFSMWDDWYHKS